MLSKDKLFFVYLEKRYKHEVLTKFSHLYGFFLYTFVTLMSVGKSVVKSRQQH